MDKYRDTILKGVVSVSEMITFCINTHTNNIVEDVIVDSQQMAIQIILRTKITTQENIEVYQHLTRSYLPAGWIYNFK